MVRRTVLGAAVVLLMMLCGDAFGAKSAANAQTRAQLDRVLPAVIFSNVTLKDAIDFLRDVSGSNIHVNWKAIEAAGITPDTAINIKLRQVLLQKVLGLLLSEASGGAGLTFYIDDGVIEITTKEIADNTMYTVVYPVQDLLVEPPPFVEPPQFDLSYASSRGGAGGGSGGRGSGSDRRPSKLHDVLDEAGSSRSTPATPSTSGIQDDRLHWRATRTSSSFTNGSTAPPLLRM